MARIYKDMDARMAKLASDSTVLDVAAEAICIRAEVNAAARTRTGEFSQAFEVRRVKRKLVTDRVVVNTHPAASAIEVGHYVWLADGSKGPWVLGQFNLLRAVHGS